MTQTRSLGKLFGVEIKIHGTFLILLAFIAISGLLKGGVTQAVVGVLLSVVVFGVVVMHEFGHILAARRFGIATKDVILSPIGGMARLQGLGSTPREEMIIAAAGPAVNLVLGGLGALLLSAPLALQASVPTYIFLALLQWFVTINFGLLIFNLIPAIPMDGGRILRAVLSKRQGHLKATQTAAKVARWSALAMALYGLYSGQFMLIFIAGFVFVMSWVELMQAAARQQARQNPLYQVFQSFQSRPQGPAHYSNVVDQNGNPVGQGRDWTVTNVKWSR